MYRNEIRLILRKNTHSCYCMTKGTNMNNTKIDKLTKNTAKAIIVIAALLSIPQQNHVQSLQSFEYEETVLLHEPTVQESPVGKTHYIDDIYFFAQKYQVSADTMMKIINCENKSYDPKLQSFHRYTEGQISRNPGWGEIGDREKSYGLVQIHIPAGHTWNGDRITKEMAQDPYLSIEFLAYHISKGNISWWTCSKMI